MFSNPNSIQLCNLHAVGRPIRYVPWKGYKIQNTLFDKPQEIRNAIHRLKGNLQIKQSKHLLGF